jgi:hypothetical protein
MNINLLAPLIGTTLSLGTIIYQTGKHAYMLENLGTTVYALGKKDEEYNKTMAIINKAISTGTDNTYSSSIKNGVFTIDLRKK